ncbi:hypothetical protein ACIBK9_47035 [Nonomuraea sp. NPDC050227]|uniref:hypothetical protein n=1 Tax=Nonomuraea sp. NPDC050227 TaxID=3364360 RepID=UPI0037AC72DB
MKRFVPLAEHPFELLFGLLFLLNGTAISFGAGPPASINATLPPAVVLAWGAIQLLAGLLIVAGIILRYWRPSLLLLGLRLERAGLWPLAAAVSVYGVVVVRYAGAPAVYTAGVLAAVAAACAARARTLARLEKTIIKYSGGAGGD